MDFVGYLKMTNIPDFQARALALDVTNSFLVQAPAGSGKTELLTQRFLKLLACVETPEEVIAITFTNKAAAEMRSRIISALEKADTTLAPQSEHEKTTWELAQAISKRSAGKNWNLQQHPNRLKILTMDALSLQIAQKLPISSKLGAQLAIAEDPHSLYQQAAKTILLSPPKDAPWLEDIKILLLYLDNDYYRLESLLITLLSKRDQWLPLMMLGNDANEKRIFLEKELAHVNEFVLQDGIGLLPAVLEKEVVALAIFASATIPWPNVGANGWSPLKKEHWLFIANMLLTQSDQLRKKSDKNIGFPPASSSKSPSEKKIFDEYKQRYQTLVNTLEYHADFIHWLTETRKLPNTNYTDSQWNVLSALLTLLPLTAAQLRLAFSEHSQVDYIENAQSALHALGNSEQPTEISLQLDYTIQHILVDEFQDTSSNQFQLLEKLTSGWTYKDGRTLFLVGDPMQSIYRFRQAEVGLFLHAKHYGIGHVMLNFVSLTSNFRSTSQLVHWTNAIFQSVFPKNELIRLGAIPYSQAHPIHKEKDSSKAECVYFLKENPLSEESYIVNKIKEIQRNFPEETIAILIRSRDHLKSITPLLLASSIAYQAVDIESLSHLPIIYDLLSLTRACMHLADRLSWISCLRAPWCGLTLEDLWTIMHASEEKTLWELILDEAVCSLLCDDAKQRLVHFRQAMTFAIQQRQRYSLRDIVEKTWTLLGGENILSHKSQRRDIERFFEVLEKITDSFGVVNLEILERKINTLFAAAPQPQTNAVQIMTIHKAKGLEFDHVFLPKLHKKTAPLDRPLIAWLEYPDADNIHHLLMAPISEVNTTDKTYDYIQQQQQQKLLLEMDRVLYVATTRAKKCIFLTATVEQNDANSIVAPSSRSLLGRIWQVHPGLFQKSINELVTEEAELKTKFHPLLHRVTLSTIQHFLQIPHENDAYEASQKNSPELVLPLHRNEARLGSIIHLLIEKIALNGIFWWKSLSLTMHQKIIQALCQQLNLSTEFYGICTEKALLAINNMVSDPRGQWILQNHSKACSEYTLLDYDYGQWAKKIIDRVLIDENGEHWIIDFKTTENKYSNISNDDFIQQAAQQYRKQLHSYKQALSRVVGHQNIHLAVYFPLLPAWYVYSS